MSMFNFIVYVLCSIVFIMKSIGIPNVLNLHYYMNPTPTLLPPDVYILPCPTLFKNHCYEDWEPDSQMKKGSFAILFY